jgi:hypothetical protein
VTGLARRVTNYAGAGVLTAGTALAATLGGVQEAGSAAPAAPVVRAVQFPESFAAQQITSVAGRLWVLGAPARAAFTDCTLREVDPSTLAERSFALPQCATGITAGDGRVYLLTNEVETGTNTRDYHIEVFDPKAGRAEVLTPIVLQNVGSAVAHSDLTFGDSTLWLYGGALGGAPEVVQISPDTGQVVSTVAGVPQIGGLYPTVAADAAGTWLGGGPGGPPQLAWATPGSTTATNSSFRPAGPDSSILWVSAVHGRVWAGVATYRSEAGATKVTTNLVALAGDGRVVVRSPSEPVGLFPLTVTPDGRLWDVQYSSKCGGSEHLLEIDHSSGLSRAVATLAAPPGACNDEDGGSELAVIGRDVFVLLPTGSPGASVLYRAAS